MNCPDKKYMQITEPKSNQARTNNELISNQKRTKKEPKRNQKRTKNEPKTNQERTKNKPKTNKKRTCFGFFFFYFSQNKNIAKFNKILDFFGLKKKSISNVKCKIILITKEN